MPWTRPRTFDDFLQTLLKGERCKQVLHFARGRVPWTMPRSPAIDFQSLTN